MPDFHSVEVFHFFFFGETNFLNIYLFNLLLATLRGMQDLSPDQGLNLYPLQWEHRVITTGLAGKSLEGFVLSAKFCYYGLSAKTGNILKIRNQSL